MIDFARGVCRWVPPIVAVILLAAASATAQQSAIVRGTVVDSATTNPTPGARVSARSLRDTATIIAGAIADRAGNFSVELPSAGGYLLQITSVGYQPRSVVARVGGGDLQLGRIVLAPRDVQGNEVVVSDQRLAAVQNGDTTELDAKAFKTAPDANVEDLVRKMPTITMQDGKIKAQGEDVQKVLVDGRPFFGDDPTATMRNLPAEMVDKIQIYDQQGDQSQFTGFNTGNSNKTINVVTRPTMRNGQFGKIYGGYGLDNKYKAGGNFSLFNGDTRISIIAQTNNVSEQNFAIEDILGAMGGGGGMFGGGMGRVMMAMGRPHGGGSSGGGGGRWSRGGGGISDFLVDSREGLSTTHAAGVNYSDRFGSVADLTASYFFNLTNTESEQTLLRQYVLPSASNQRYNEQNNSESDNINHRFNAKLDLRLDSLNSITLRPRLTLQQNDGSSSLRGNNSAGEVQTGASNSTTATDLTGLSFSNDLLFRHSFGTPGRTFSANLSTSYNSNIGTSNQRSDNSFLQPSPSFDTLIQNADLDKNGWSASGNLSYTEPLATGMGLLFSYAPSVSVSNSDQQTMSPLDGGTVGESAMVLDSALSSRAESRTTTHTGGVTYQYRDSTWELSAGASYQWSGFQYDDQFPIPSTVERTYGDLLPTASVRYNFSRDASLRLSYRTSVSMPGVDQLQSALNNSNPLLLSIGDPSLQESYQHNLFVRYSSTNVPSASNFFAMLGGSLTSSYIGNQTIIPTRDTTLANGVAIQQGAQLTQPINLDGYISARSFASYGFPVSFLKSNLNLFASANYTRTPGIINNVQNDAHAPSVGIGVVLSSNISEAVDFTISNNFTGNLVRNSVRQDQNTEYTNNIARARLSWTLFENVVLGTDLTHQSNNGLAEENNGDYLLWNASLGVKFLPENRGELRLAVNDILNQNTSVSRTVNDAYIEDLKSTVLGRYALLTFTYSIRNFGGMSLPTPFPPPGGDAPPPPPPGR
ncbi:MAG: TonB-dependent receptor [Chlorobi bacterium]|nr:TonB-dependent receptor [Chlorobiota bacterium]MBX7216602.1 TonB-dependent receptor [Candidatus Kapabacteria bacterium]